MKFLGQWIIKAVRHVGTLDVVRNPGLPLGWRTYAKSSNRHASTKNQDFHSELQREPPTQCTKFNPTEDCWNMLVPR